MRKFIQKIKALLQTVHSGNGAYSVGTIALVIGIAVVLNLIVGQIPESARSIDISSDSIYDISKASRTFLKELESDITLTIVAEKKNIDERILKFVNKYAGLSDKIEVKQVDPVSHPSALTDYDTEENTIVVKNKETKKQRSVAFSDIIAYDQEAYYYYGTQQETEFDAEGQLTSAVQYVTNGQGKTVYYTQGHGEGSFSDALSDLMEKANYSVSELNLLMKGSIPDDCDLLIMDAPSKDISEEEQSMLTAYLGKGGKLMLLLGAEADTPNLDKLMKEYGLEKADGYIADMQRCYQGNYYYIFPEITASGDMAKGLTNNMVLLINSLGLTQVDAARETITTESFMTTSNDGYAVTDNGQKQGTYILGAVATEEISGDDSEAEKTNSRLTVIASNSMVDEQITDAFSTVENLTLFMNAVNANFDDTQSISIEPKSLEIQYNTVHYTGLFSILTIFGIPLIVLIAGFVTWMRRRKA